MDFIIDNHLQGLVIGICTFLIIGMFHPIVVKAEYYWNTRCWWFKEIFEQEKRVQKGWFPKNPKRTYKF